MKDRIATCQLASRDGQAVLVQLAHSVPPNLSRLLTDPVTRKVFHYAVFDASFMARARGVRPANIACTKVRSNLLDPHSKKYILKITRLTYMRMNLTS